MTAFLLFLNLNSGYVCACPTGVKLKEGSNTTCYNSPQSMLLVAQRSIISKISLDSPDFTPYTLPLKDLKRALTVDFDPKSEYIYWADSQVSFSDPTPHNPCCYILHYNFTTTLHLKGHCWLDVKSEYMYWAQSGKLFGSISPKITIYVVICSAVSKISMDTPDFTTTLHLRGPRRPLTTLTTKIYWTDSQKSFFGVQKRWKLT